MFLDNSNEESILDISNIMMLSKMSKIYSLYPTLEGQNVQGVIIMTVRVCGECLKCKDSFKKISYKNLNSIFFGDKVVRIITFMSFK